MLIRSIINQMQNFKIESPQAIRGKLAEKGRMAQSFILENDNEIDRAENSLVSEKPSTLLSMIHYNPKQTKEEIFKDALSHCSKGTFSKEQNQMREILSMSDWQFKEKYLSDPFFKMKTNLKLKKKVQKKRKSSYSISEQEQDSKGDKEKQLLTLAQTKNQAEDQINLLSEKFQRVFGKKMKL